MSVNLYWYKPPSERKSLGGGGTGLKYMLAERYTERDGSCHAEFTLTAERDLGFIDGLAAAGVEDAKKLADDLQKYGSLEVEFK